MEFQAIVNLFDMTSDNKDLPRFVTKKWIEVCNQSEKNYNVNKEIRIKIPMLRSDICYFSDAYIIVKGTTGLEFQITDTTLCVPVVTLSKKQNKKKRRNTFRTIKIRI